MADVTQGISQPETILVDTLRISRYAVVLGEEKVVAGIEAVDDNGQVYDTFEVTFWNTMPTMPEILDGNGLPFDPPQYEDTPENWFSIPGAAVPVLMSLATDILTAVNNRMFP